MTRIRQAPIPGTDTLHHGAPLMDRAVPGWIAWVRDLACGVELIGSGNYRVPA